VGGYAGSGRLTAGDCVYTDTSMPGGGGGGGDAGVSAIGVFMRFSDVVAIVVVTAVGSAAGRVHVVVCVAIGVGVCVADGCVGVGAVSARITITGS
jgi:hypothetical protein